MIMPQHEEHCKNSEKRYGIRGEEIHTWMDEPSQVAGGSHRDFRHDLSSLQTAIQLFSGLYGTEMVENIFLDHLKADSAESRKKAEVIKESSGGIKLWSIEEDEYLLKNFLIKTDAELELYFKSKTKASILKRRQYLGLIRPKMIKRTRKHTKEQRLVFRLQRGQKIFLNISVNGGNNDIDFLVTNKKGDGLSKKIIGEVNIGFTPRCSDNYSFIFSNSFSLVTRKQVAFHYQLENGRKIGIMINL